MTNWRRGWDKEVCKFVVRYDMAARLQIASVGEYSDDNEDFESYTERLIAWLVVNGVTDEQKCSVFLAVIGSTTYKLLKSVLAPDKPNIQTFNELVNVLQRHYKPKPLIIAERFRFYKRQQQEGETVASFSVALRQLSSSRDFGAFLPEALRTHSCVDCQIKGYRGSCWPKQT